MSTRFRLGNGNRRHNRQLSREPNTHQVLNFVKCCSMCFITFAVKNLMFHYLCGRTFNTSKFQKTQTNKYFSLFYFPSLRGWILENVILRVSVY